MSRREPLLIAAAVFVVAAVAFAGWLPTNVELGSLLALAALALLLQGLVRDLHTLALLRRASRAGPSAAPVEEVSCICLESTVGLSAILVGVGLTAFGLALPVSTQPLLWTASAAAVWAFGCATRDVVIQWNPWALRRVRDHGSLVVRWKANRRQGG